MNTPDGNKICPFSEFTFATVPQAVYKQMRIEWQPILWRIENTPSLSALDDAHQTVANLIFNLATEYLKQLVYGFILKDKKI